MPSLCELEYLQEIFTRLNAEKPAGIGDNGQTQYQERTGGLFQRLDLEVKSLGGQARVLLTGQIGVGKSSELWHFLHPHRPAIQYHWIHCDLEKEAHPERCGATGVFLTILRDCWGATKGLREARRRFTDAQTEKIESIRDEIIEQFIDWLRGGRSEDGQKVIFRFGGMDFPIPIEPDRDRAVALILGKATQHEAVSDRAERFGLIPDALVLLINKLLKWFNWITNKSPLLIIDHVDKIRDESSVREVLIDVQPQWGRIEGSIIMTAPYEYTLGGMRNSIEVYWKTPFMLYPVEYPELENQDPPEFYWNIIQSCDLAENIAPEHVTYLAHYSGGIPRTFVQFIIQACKEAHLAQHENIHKSDIERVVYAAEPAYQDYNTQDLELLTKIIQHQTGLREAAILLRSPISLLVLPGEQGKNVFRVHPLAEKLLDRYQRGLL